MSTSTTSQGTIIRSIRIFRTGLCVFLFGLAIASPAYPQIDDIDEVTRRTSGNAKELESQAGAVPPQTEDKLALAIFFHKRGQAKRRLGDYQGAVADLRLALANNSGGGSRPDEWGDRWRIQGELYAALRNTGDHFAVLDHVKSVVPEAANSTFNYHAANLQLSAAYVSLGNFAEAERSLAEANNVVPRMRRAQNWHRFGFSAMALNQRFNAVFFRQQGNYAEAERLFRLSLDNSEKNLALQKATQVQGNLFTRMAADNLAITRLQLAQVLATRGKFGEAEAYARAGLEDRLATYAFNTDPVSGALAVLGNIRLEQGDVEAAQKFHRHAVAAQQSSGALRFSTDLGSRRAGLGNALLFQSLWPHALRIFEERAAALRLDSEQLKRVGNGHVGWALALAKTGQAKRASEMLERMIASRLAKHSVPNKYYLAQMRGVLGMAYTSLGNTDAALAAFKLAIPEMSHRDQDDGGTESMSFSGVFWRRVIIEGYLELLGKLHLAGAAPAGLDLADESFKLADTARGSGVQAAISATAARAQLPNAALTEIARKDQDGLNRIVALNEILGRLSTAPEGERLNKVIGDMQADIEQLRKQHTTLRAEITRRFPEYAALIDPKSPSLADAAKALNADEALVAIYLGDTQAYVWTMAAQGRRAFRVVQIARTEFDTDVAKLRSAVEFGNGDLSQLPAFELARAHKLYGLLLEPDAALWKDAKILNVIPHGALAQLPFSLLVTASTAVQPGPGAQAGYRDVPWLARKVAVAQLPSASALIALRRAPAGKTGREPFVGFGDPLFSAEAGGTTRRGNLRNLAIARSTDATGERIEAVSKTLVPSEGRQEAVMVPSRASAFNSLSNLPDTADELKEIATTLKANSSRDLFLGRQASERNVKQAKLEDRRVVAFATHGIAPGEITGLDQPALALSNPALTGDKDDDGFLTMEEVLGLRLDADWVILSACNTASADGKGSEAVSGLGRAFFYAGARSLLVSNWAVESTSARHLTTELFRQQVSNPSLRRAEALRQSMLSLMEMSVSDSTGRTTTTYSHPAFWAPFSLVGDGTGP